LEYTVVGDTVNLAQRLQDLARPAHQIVLGESTYRALPVPPKAEKLDPITVKGRAATIQTYRITMNPDDEEARHE
jgi:class 3 adenylate cyclase